MPGRRRLVAGTLAAGLAAAGLVGAAVVGTGGGGSSSGTAAGTAAAVRIASVQGLRWCSLHVGGRTRRYLLYVPPAVSGSGRPAPLVLAFHGLHLSAAWMAADTGLVQAADRAGVVLALPDAVSGAWNDGRLGPHGPDDLRFADALVTSLVRSGVADPGRITVSGYSNGAELAMVLAARDPGRFAALVSVSGALPALPGSPRPSAPLPAYFVHGSADPVQPWGGRPTRNRLHPALLSETATVHAFVAANRGAGQAQQIPTGSTAVEQFVWRPGPGGGPVVLYRLLGAGHGWPTRPGSSTAVVSAGRLDAAALVMQVASGDQARRS